MRGLPAVAGIAGVFLRHCLCSFEQKLEFRYILTFLNTYDSKSAHGILTFIQFINLFYSLIT